MLCTRRIAVQLLFPAFFLGAIVFALSAGADRDVTTPADKQGASAEYPRPPTTPLDDEGSRSASDVAGLTEDMVPKALLEARREVLEEERLVKRDPQRKARGHTHQSMHYRNRYHADLEPSRKRALIAERTMKKVAYSLGMKTRREKRSLYGVTSPGLSRLSCFGRPRPVCDPSSRFRTADGTCNNLLQPTFGAANTPHTRLRDVGTDYADGISAPRVSVTGAALPNARLASFVLFTDMDIPSRRLSHLTMVWGQWTDHETTLGAQPDIMCEEQCDNPDRECVNIPILPGDPRFPPIGVFCIPLRRDVPAVPASCGQMGPREQVNTLPAYIDSSQIYGGSEEIQQRERDLNPDVGRLLERPHPAGPGLRGLLPVMTNGTCRSPNPFIFPCFRSGDERTNENQGLGALHHVFTREHNRIAQRLRQLNAHWTGDRIFQETRKIMGAINQHITYGEYLTEVLDPTTRERFGLNLLADGFSDDYDPSINPGVFNSFAAAAFRFGHSQIRNTLSRFGENGQQFMEIDASDNHDPSYLYDLGNGGIDAILRGLVFDPAMSVDGFFSRAIQENLRRDENDISDLLAINLQRGRERGVPGYNSFRRACGLTPFTSFDDFKTIMPGNIVERMRYLYKSHEDVDLFAGGVMERELPGGALGPTFACIIAEQFRNLRFGDRFWYERADPTVGFTAPQLTELRKASLARLFCDNSDNIGMMPKRLLSIQSQPVPCNSLPTVDLRYWKELRNHY